MNQVRGTIRQKSIAFHFTEAQTTLATATLDFTDYYLYVGLKTDLCWLTSDSSHFSLCTSVHFIKNHMFQLLIVDRPHENVRLE